MRITLYAHISKESARAAGEQAGLSGEALEMFMYAGYEHRIDYEVDPQTGKAVAVEFDDRQIT